jgi:hypothetical protein
VEEVEMKWFRVVASAAVAPLTLVAVLALSTDGKQAQALFQRKVYSAKFLCGLYDPSSSPPPVLPREGPVKPGNYQTAINVLNPTRHTLTFVKKAVLLFDSLNPPPPTVFEDPKPPGPYHLAQLKPNWGFEIDCPDIRQKLLGLPPPPPGFPEPFIKGYVVIETFGNTDFVDVVGAYTSHGIVVGSVCIAPGTALDGTPCDPTDPTDPCLAAGFSCVPGIVGTEGFSTDVERVPFTISNF